MSHSGASWGRGRASAHGGALIPKRRQQLLQRGRANLREVSVLLGVFLSRSRRGWQVWLGAALVVLGMVLTTL